MTPGGPAPALLPPVEPAAAALLVLWILLVAADQRALGSFQIHQPLVSATVAGFILGAPAEGLLVGAAVQALWIRPLPAGGVIPPATGLGAAAGAVWVWWVEARLSQPGPAQVASSWLFLAAVILAAAWGGVWVERRVRRVNAVLEEAGLRALARSGRGLGRRLCAGVGLASAAGAVFAAVVLLGASAVWMLLLERPGWSGAAGPNRAGIAFVLTVLLGVAWGTDAASLGRESWRSLPWVAAGVLLGLGLSGVVDPWGPWRP